MRTPSHLDPDSGRPRRPESDPPLIPTIVWVALLCGAIALAAALLLDPGAVPADLLPPAL